MEDLKDRYPPTKLEGFENVKVFSGNVLGCLCKLHPHDELE